MARLPPSPSASPLAQAVRYGADPHGFLLEQHRALGDLWTMRLPNTKPMVMVCDPELVREIFALPEDAHVARELEVTLDLGDYSLLFLDGQRHREERRLLMPALHGARLKALGGLMRSTTRRHISRWPLHEPFNLTEAMREVTRAVITATVFGVEEGPRAERLDEAFSEWLDMALSPPVMGAGLVFGASRVRQFLNRQARIALAKPPRRAVLPWTALAQRHAGVIRLLREEVAAARGRDDRSDVLAMLLGATYEDGRPITERHVIDELLTLLVGGHETTSNTLCWALRELLRRPDVAAVARDEVERSCDDVDLASPTALPYIDAIAKEAMRLHPIAPAVPRVLAHPVELGEHRFPAGVQLTPCSVVIHRRADLWHDAEAFEPARFVGRHPPGHHYFPFGGGQRRCIGMAFATFEMRIVLAELLGSMRLRLVSAPSHGSMRGITAAPGKLEVVRWQ